MLTFRPSDLVVRLENAEFLDPIVEQIRGIVDKALGPQLLRDLLHGVPLGHPLHPLLVQVPLGAWLSTAVLDLIPGTERAARALIGVGILSAAPSAASGYADWSQTEPSQLRVGVVHSSANLAALVLYAISWQQRKTNRTLTAGAFSYAGLAVVSAGGFLGGHLAYRQRVGVDHSDDLSQALGTDWHDLGPVGELPEGQLCKRELAGVPNTPLLVFRRGDKVSVLSDVCSHLAGPLHEGELVDSDGGNPCVVCPWHQSTFSLESGEVIHGPATAPQPCLRTRVKDGVVQVAVESGT